MSFFNFLLIHSFFHSPAKRVLSSSIAIANKDILAICSIWCDALHGGVYPDRLLQKTQAILLPSPHLLQPPPYPLTMAEILQEMEKRMSPTPDR